VRLGCATTFCAALLFAGAAQAQLAVVTTSATDEPRHRQLVGAVVEAALARWEPLSPQLLPEDLRDCSAADVECLRDVARQRGASHVLILGVAPLGPRAAVVAAQLFAVDTARALFEETAMQPGDEGGKDEGLGAVRELAARLLKEQGPPGVIPRPPPEPPPLPPAPSAVGVLGIGGASALGLGVLGIGATAAVAASAFVEDEDYAATTSAVAVGGSVSALLIIVGAGLMAADTL
jgi:hypothetical protein